MSGCGRQNEAFGIFRAIFGGLPKAAAAEWERERERERESVGKRGSLGEEQFAFKPPAGMSWEGWEGPLDGTIVETVEEAATHVAKCRNLAGRVWHVM